MQAVAWEQMESDQVNDKITRQMTNGASSTIARLVMKRDGFVPRHSHPNEQITTVLEGLFKLTFDDGEAVLQPGQVIVIPPNVPHAGRALEDSIVVDFFSPRREDWIRKEDSYFRAGGAAPQK
ncbi:MAG TPA: cupin domain-containing protein [Candidatus Dormibacteraeota bacterium]|nr:cupin domain-containing protein [Candidatus Dormibacteraeota bacterium]